MAFKKLPLVKFVKPPFRTACIVVDLEMLRFTLSVKLSTSISVIFYAKLSLSIFER